MKYTPTAETKYYQNRGSTFITFAKLLGYTVNNKPVVRAIHIVDGNITRPRKEYMTGWHPLPQEIPASIIPEKILAKLNPK